MMVQKHAHRKTQLGTPKHISLLVDNTKGGRLKGHRHKKKNNRRLLSQTAQILTRPAASEKVERQKER